MTDQRTLGLTRKQQWVLLAAPVYAAVCAANLEKLQREEGGFWSLHAAVIAIIIAGPLTLIYWGISALIQKRAADARPYGLSSGTKIRIEVGEHAGTFVLERVGRDWVELAAEGRNLRLSKDAIPPFEVLD